MRNIRLGSLLGIPIYVNPSWFILFGVVMWFLATSIFPDVLRDSSRSTHVAMAAVSAVMFFISILLHELAHSIVARWYKIPVKSLTLFLLGGVAQITRDATKPLSEMLMAAAGPFTSLLLGGLFLGIWALQGTNADSPVDVVLLWLGGMNIVLAVFNMIPAFPMDGGRVFRSLLWLITGNYYRATIIAAWMGRGFGWIMICAGFLGALGYDVFIADSLRSGIWIIVMGFFIENAARQGIVQNKLVAALSRYRASDLMIADPPTVDPAISVSALARGVLELNPRVCYFVEEHGKLMGIISSYQMRAIPESRWMSTTAGQAMIPSAKLHAVAPDRMANEVLLQMETDDLTHLPVVASGRVVGVIGRDRIVTILKQAGLIR
ncbi:hypothetical protein AYO38_00955 [bacterium SCGC AG-212-C10]|nr:hypothetical protein AYO38_00955 [bacterium SCGC AG-212-C10]